MRVLICGGRHFKDEPFFNATMDRLHKERGPFTMVIEGGQTGADYLASWWADYHQIYRVTERADWTKHKNTAGQIRNQRMIDIHRPDLVVAFQGGSGTADMVPRAEAAGIEVIKIRWSAYNR